MFLDIGVLQSQELKLILEKTVEGNDHGWIPAYHFAICDHDGTKMGFCDLRIGHNENVSYGGNIGYAIYEPFRGHHYAGKACLLLFELSRKHNLEYVMITCDPDNQASRKTCEYIGGTLLETAQLPKDNDMRKCGDTEKCIFRVDL